MWGGQVSITAGMTTVLITLMMKHECLLTSLATPTSSDRNDVS